VTRLLLEARNLTLGYGGVPIIHDLTLSIAPGEVLAMIGANGAGKTTTLLGLAGAIEPIGGSVVFEGSSQFRGLHLNARRGMALLTDDRSIFRELTVWENLRIGRGDPKVALSVFHQLEPLRDRKAGLLSGGEQQMLGLARVIAARPKLLLADELSLGLAPVVVKPLFQSIRRLADELGTGVILVEQHVRSVLQMADTAVVLQRGALSYNGPASDLRGDEERITRSYLSAETSSAEDAPPASTPGQTPSGT
jgi:branched-chain amino acid transport system ATP-binding protein